HRVVAGGAAEGHGTRDSGLVTRGKARSRRGRCCPSPESRLPSPERSAAMSRSMRLAELLPEVAGIPAELTVSRLTLGRRDVKHGDAFVAISGFGTHGLNFCAQARDAGAAAILFEPPAPDELPAPADAMAVPGLRSRKGAMADEFHGHPSRAMTMVGVTGTSGKTSTVQLLAQALDLLGTRSGTIGTLGVGLYGEAVATGFTTPLVLQM